MDYTNQEKNYHKCVLLINCNFLMMSYFCKPFRSFGGAFIYFYSSSYSLFTTKTGVNPPNATHRLPPKFRCPVLPPQLRFTITPTLSIPFSGLSFIT